MQKATTIGSARAISVENSELVVVKGINVQQALADLDQYISNLELTGGSGSPGTPGAPGSPGADGESAYQLWLDAGNSGTEADFLASLEGPAGPPGADGADFDESTLDTLYMRLPANPSDGDSAVWDEASGLWVAASRVASGQELAHAENVSDVTQSLSVASGAFATLDITGTNITLPVSSEPVWLVGEVVASQTVAGVGMMNLFLVETTSGSDVIVASKPATLPNSTNSHNNGVGLPQVRRRYASVATPRTFKLQVRLGSVGTTPTVIIANGSSAPSYLSGFAA